ncbi:helix-turn-helix transcriptional regulator [Bacillus sp. FJAT-45037]|uniref:helix-turn-helix transcriptional regulator n=1 Tax=Bacillus sp. FJAT-45037 TaxID=2011007 RepID=UPI000C245D16|nr:helix-turn-helix transcriptional regulator [Bacillus sp. FJAT-45037]
MKNRVKEFRQEHDMSQEHLANMLGVSRQTIISIEKGRYNPSLPLAIEIARIFNTIVEKVFLIDDEDE